MVLRGVILSVDFVFNNCVHKLLSKEVQIAAILLCAALNSLCCSLVDVSPLLGEIA